MYTLLRNPQHESTLFLEASSHKGGHEFEYLRLNHSSLGSRKNMSRGAKAVLQRLTYGSLSLYGRHT